MLSCGQSLTGSSTRHYSLRVLQPPISPTIHICLRILTKKTRTLINVPKVGIQEVSMEEPLKSGSRFRGEELGSGDAFQFMEEKKYDEIFVEKDRNQNEQEKEDINGREPEKGISRIRVPRQRYIPVSKADLLDAIVANLFNSKNHDLDKFLLLSSCLDSILHAEHKTILEELRTDYFMDNEETSSQKTDVFDKNVNGKSSDSIVNGTIEFLEDKFRFGSLPKSAKRLSVASRFQRTFMQLLNNAQFEELSAADLMMTSSLNSDYLLTLPVYVDWKKASESNAIIFRRGYAAERQKGLLLVEKLDYIQSKLLQKIFFTISKPLGTLGKWIDEGVSNGLQTEEAQDWINRLKPWLKELSVIQSYFNNEEKSDGILEKDELSDSPVPIWLAAQRAVSRYEGFLSPSGPRERLFRKFLSWIGRLPPTPETTYDHDKDSSPDEPYLRPSFLSRISLSDIWRPASRKNCGNNLWTMLKTSVSILFSESMLQEPAHQELILLYNKDSERNTKYEDEVPPLQLKIYERIPIPDLPVIFPHKKLSFRIIDTVRLDIATIVGLLAYFINYKFEDIKASPSAIVLDVIAISALILFVTRVALGYKQTWDRYQLLVNKTLYEKTLASGFGSVHFLLDASEQQQYKEAILTYAILLKAENGQVTCRESVGDECERFMYDAFKEKVEMPVDKAMDTLVRLGLVTETSGVDGRTSIQAVPCTAAYESLRELWGRLL